MEDGYYAVTCQKTIVESVSHDLFPKTDFLLMSKLFAFVLFCYRVHGIGIPRFMLLKSLFH